MEIRIGIKHAARELSIETEGSDDSAKKVITDALENGARSFSVTDAKNREVFVLTENVQYVEFKPQDKRHIGFVS